MTGPWLYAITVGPLGLYFWVLGHWHGGSRPRVVSGLVDFGLLAFGIGGVVAFGPLGQAITAAIFGRPDRLDWLAFLAGLGLVASAFARRSLRGVVIYHVDRRALDAALVATLRTLRPEFRRTLHGFEQPETGRWIVAEQTPWLRTAVVEVHGRDPDPLVRRLRDGLREGLAGVASPPSPLARGFRALAVSVLVAPIAATWLAEAETRDALRAFLNRLRGQ